jgi:hypothetical protein
MYIIAFAWFLISRIAFVLFMALKLAMGKF